MKKAFTLVEVMIVVAILGLLAAIAIPNFLRAHFQDELKIKNKDYAMALWDKTKGNITEAKRLIRTGWNPSEVKETKTDSEFNTTTSVAPSVDDLKCPKCGFNFGKYKLVEDTL